MAENDAPRRAFQPEDLIAGRYRVLRFLAAGNRGEVYAVEDTTSRERIALKTIRPDDAGKPRAIERLRREMVLARGISHPGICRVFDLGRHEVGGSDDGDGKAVFFLTMELLEGETLEERLRRQRCLTVSEAEPLVRQLCEALHAAHHGGVLHRDLKTANIFLAEGRDGPRVVITDFGLAHVLREGNSSAVSMTASEAVVGTPVYMPPEQLMGEVLSAASDIYALGIVLFEMVTGERPLEAATPVGILLLRSKRAPPSPRTIVPNLDRAWEATILRCLHPVARRRYQDATEVVAALKDDGRGRRQALLAGTLGMAALAILFTALFWWRPWDSTPDARPALGQEAFPLTFQAPLLGGIPRTVKYAVDLLPRDCGTFGRNIPIMIAGVGRGNALGFFHSAGADDSDILTLAMTIAGGSEIARLSTLAYASGTVVNCGANSRCFRWQLVVGGEALQLQKAVRLWRDPRVAAGFYISEEWRLTNLGTSSVGVRGFSEYLHTDDRAEGRDSDGDGVEDSLLDIDSPSASWTPMLLKAFGQAESLRFVISNADSYDYNRVTVMRRVDSEVAPQQEVRLSSAFYATGVNPTRRAVERQLLSDARYLLEHGALVPDHRVR